MFLNNIPPSFKKIAIVRLYFEKRKQLYNPILSKSHLSSRTLAEKQGGLLDITDFFCYYKDFFQQTSLLI
jgi:hypothetical protein